MLMINIEYCIFNNENLSFEKVIALLPNNKTGEGSHDDWVVDGADAGAL